MGDPSFVKDLAWDRGNASNVSVSAPCYKGEGEGEGEKKDIYMEEGRESLP